MDKLYTAFFEIASAFNKHDVRYLLVGGMAVIAHGVNRTTGDIDLWVEDSEKNTERLKAGLAELGFGEKEVIQAINFFREQGKLIIHLYEQAAADIMPVFSSKISFADAWQKRRIIRIGDTDCNVIDFHSLIEMKIAAGRMQDLRDVKDLQEKQGDNDLI